MTHTRPRTNSSITIRNLFPDCDADRLREAEERFNEYIEHAIRMYERIGADPEAYARFKALTAARRHHTM